MGKPMAPTPTNVTFMSSPQAGLLVDVAFDRPSRAALALGAARQASHAEFRTESGIWLNQNP
jgi:hypothetical protein